MKSGSQAEETALNNMCGKEGPGNPPEKSSSLNLMSQMFKKDQPQNPTMQKNPILFRTSLNYLVPIWINPAFVWKVSSPIQEERRHKWRSGKKYDLICICSPHIDFHLYKKYIYIIPKIFFPTPSLKISVLTSFSA